ncbi:hypothetical protein GPECTOR_77g46 [Gonium pectorale]|uniref:Uncharacterized protein n=1 Tax=Gonium pectorale TaxID=33097 RepID=A0A150G3S0_GONPE|nr:hypothetical protein GPECTOR_77g46 [Gonium pectorale]|eukprot:KXZ43950.1 hypothetical protein GPECTOR_77g46 [Gonium pectorale]
MASTTAMKRVRRKPGDDGQQQTGDGSGEDSAQSTMTLMQWYRVKFVKSKPRYIIEALNAVMSLVSVCTYVYDTYIPIPHINRWVYLMCSVTFSVEYVAKLLAAKKPLRYIFWDWSLIDVATIVYGVIYFNYNISDTGLGFVRLLRIIQVIRLLKVASSTVLRYSRSNIQPMQLEYVRRSVELGLTLFGVTFIAGCVFYELEVAEQDLQLHQAIYWSCVTIATIGYGDYAPRTVAGQLLFPLVIVIIILVLPRKITSLSEVMQTFSRFMRRAHVSSAFGLHVVLTGHVTPLSAQTFIGEFFHPDRGYQDLELLLLRPCDPEPQLVITMNNVEWERRVKYLHGSPFKAEDLARADTARALAVFVMANKYAADPAAEDTRTLLAVLAIAQYLRQFGNPDGVPPPRVTAHVSHPHIVAQFLLDATLDNAVALLASGACHPPELGLLPLEVSPFPICVGHLRASLLGASVHTPGLITLISNLCISCSLTRRTLLGKQDLSLVRTDYWGCSFKEAALRMWREEEVILLGLRFPNHVEEKQRFDVRLAPLPEASGRSGGGAFHEEEEAAEGPDWPYSYGRRIGPQTIGFILNDDALVLDAAAWGLKSALDPHDDPDMLCAKATYPPERLAMAHASGSRCGRRG